MNAPCWERLIAGLEFPEALRWHDGALWCSDVGAGRVLALDEVGRLVRDLRVGTSPVGIGFTPDGAVVVQEMDGSLHTIVGDEDSVTALGRHSPHIWVDLAMDDRGRAYSSNIGCSFDPARAAVSAERIRTSGCIWSIDCRDGVRREVDGGLALPNGMIVADARSLLIVAESRASRLTAFPILEDGTLGAPRLFASLPADPDGICGDADGAVWAALPALGTVVRVRDGGEVLESIPLGDRRTVSVALGGSDGRTLFVASVAPETPPPPRRGPASWTGTIDFLHVEVPMMWSSGTNA